MQCLLDANEPRAARGACRLRQTVVGASRDIYEPNSRSKKRREAARLELAHISRFRAKGAGRKCSVDLSEGQITVCTNEDSMQQATRSKLTKDKTGLGTAVRPYTGKIPEPGNKVRGAV